MRTPTPLAEAADVPVGATLAIVALLVLLACLHGIRAIVARRIDRRALATRQRVPQQRKGDHDR